MENPEAMLDILSMETFRQRFGANSASDEGCHGNDSPFPDSDDLDLENMVRHLCIDDSIAGCFAETGSQTKETVDAKAWLPASETQTSTCSSAIIPEDVMESEELNPHPRQPSPLGTRTDQAERPAPTETGSGFEAPLRMIKKTSPGNTSCTVGQHRSKPWNAPIVHRAPPTASITEIPNVDLVLGLVQDRTSNRDARVSVLDKEFSFIGGTPSSETLGDKEKLSQNDTSVFTSPKSSSNGVLGGSFSSEGRTGALGAEIAMGEEKPDGGDFKENANGNNSRPKASVWSSSPSLLFPYSLSHNIETQQRKSVFQRMAQKARLRKKRSLNQKVETTHTITLSDGTQAFPISSDASSLALDEMTANGKATSEDMNNFKSQTERLSLSQFADCDLKRSAEPKKENTIQSRIQCHQRIAQSRTLRDELDIVTSMDMRKRKPWYEIEVDDHIALFQNDRTTQEKSTLRSLIEESARMVSPEPDVSSEAPSDGSVISMEKSKSKSKWHSTEITDGVASASGTINGIPYLVQDQLLNNSASIRADVSVHREDSNLYALDLCTNVDDENELYYANLQPFNGGPSLPTNANMTSLSKSCPDVSQHDSRKGDNISDRVHTSMTGSSLQDPKDLLMDYITKDERELLKELMLNNSVFQKTDFRQGTAEANTPFHLAVELGRLECLRFLLQSQPLLDQGGWTECFGHDLARMAVRMNQVKCLLLLHHMMGLEAMTGAVDPQGNTLMHVAASLNHTDITVALISLGHNVNVENKAGVTPLELCLQHSVFSKAKDQMQALSAVINKAKEKGSTSNLEEDNPEDSEVVSVLNCSATGDKLGDQTFPDRINERHAFSPVYNTADKSKVCSKIGHFREGSEQTIPRDENKNMVCVSDSLKEQNDVKLSNDLRYKGINQREPTSVNDLRYKGINQREPTSVNDLRYKGINQREPTSVNDLRYKGINQREPTSVPEDAYIKLADCDKAPNVCLTTANLIQVAKYVLKELMRHGSKIPQKDQWLHSSLEEAKHKTEAIIEILTASAENAPERKQQNHEDKRGQGDFLLPVPEINFAACILDRCLQCRHKKETLMGDNNGKADPSTMESEKDKYHRDISCDTHLPPEPRSLDSFIRQRICQHIESLQKDHRKTSSSPAETESYSEKQISKPVIEANKKDPPVIENKLLSGSSISSDSLKSFPSSAERNPGSKANRSSMQENVISGEETLSSDRSNGQTSSAQKDGAVSHNCKSKKQIIDNFCISSDELYNSPTENIPPSPQKSRCTKQTHNCLRKQNRQALEARHPSKGKLDRQALNTQEDNHGVDSRCLLHKDNPSCNRKGNSEILSLFLDTSSTSQQGPNEDGQEGYLKDANDERARRREVRRRRWGGLSLLPHHLKKKIERLSQKGKKNRSGGISGSSNSSSSVVTSSSSSGGRGGNYGDGNSSVRTIVDFQDDGQERCNLNHLQMPCHFQPMHLKPTGSSVHSLNAFDLGQGQDDFRHGTRKDHSKRHSADVDNRHSLEALSRVEYPDSGQFWSPLDSFSSMSTVSEDEESYFTNSLSDLSFGDEGDSVSGRSHRHHQHNHRHNRLREQDDDDRHNHHHHHHHNHHHHHQNHRSHHRRRRREGRWESPSRSRSRGGNNGSEDNADVDDSDDDDNDDSDESDDPRVNVNVDNEEWSDEMLRVDRLAKHLDSVQRLQCSNSQVTEKVITGTGEVLMSQEDGTSEPNHVNIGEAYPFSSAHDVKQSRPTSRSKRTTSPSGFVGRRAKIHLFNHEKLCHDGATETIRKESVEGTQQETSERRHRDMDKDVPWNLLTFSDSDGSDFGDRNSR